MAFFLSLEKWLAKITDTLITINDEDYQTSTEGKFQTKVEKIPGIGVQTSRLCFPSDEHRHELRMRFNLAPDDTVVVYMAEFIKRKNHRMIIEALAILKDEYPHLKVLFLGSGPLFDAMRRFAKSKGVSTSIIFVGSTRAIGPILAGCDIGISASKTEGLPMNIAEEMYVGLPIVASDVRGHRDLIESGKTGLLFNPDSVEDFVACLRRYLDNPAFAAQMAAAARQKVRGFLLDRSLEALSGIYRRLLGK